MAEDDYDDLLNLLLDDQIPLDSSIDLDIDEPERKIVKRRTRKHSRVSLQCAVCGDHAEGYNFDAISCESCKAFFRRNALRPPGKLKCRANGNCPITVETRKRCKKCRLEKCFRIGMRKEWILSEDEKRKKRCKIEENRRHRWNRPETATDTTVVETTPPVPTTTSEARSSNSSDYSSPIQNPSDMSHPMTVLDWSKVQLIQTAYNESINTNQVIGVPLYPATQRLNSTLDIIRIPTYLSSIRLITFFKKIPEFSLFSPEDRTTLVKHNLLAVVFMHVVLIYDPVQDTYHEHNTPDPIFQGKDWISHVGERFYREMTRTAIQLIRIVEYDRVIVKFLLLIILFTKGFCAYDIEHEPSLTQLSFVFNSQNVYLETLFKYCLHQYGYQRTIRLFTNLINQLMAIQRISIELKDCVHTIIEPHDLSPLMQTVLQLSDSDSIQN